MHKFDNSSPSPEALDGLEAYLDSLEGNPDIALGKIEGMTDPDNIRRRLAILIDNARNDDAAAEARLREKSEVWIDLAVYSFSAIGSDTEAVEYLNWAKAFTKAAFWQKSVIGYYDGTMVAAFRSRGESEGIVPSMLSVNEHESVQRAAVVVKAACSPAFALGRCDTELDVQLLLRLLDASYWLAAHDVCLQVVQILQKRVPLPLGVAHAFLRGVSGPVDNIVDRLWREHGESFVARHLSCMIQARDFADEELALERAYQLVGLAKSKDDKEKLCGLICGLTKFDDSIALERAIKTATALLGETSRLLQILKADIFLAKGDAPAALSIAQALDTTNDPQVLRIKALAKLKTGELAEALTILQELSRIAPSPWVFMMISDVAKKHGDEKTELEALELWLALAPGEHNARSRLSIIYGQRGAYKKATQHLETLHQQFPDDVAVIVNLAITYFFDGKHDSALSILDSSSANIVSTLPIVKTRAQILHAAGRPLDAFNALDEIRGDHWEDPQFLSSYMTVCHAAGEEKQAHEALKKLLDLKKGGLVDDNMISEASLDDVVKMMSAAAKRSEQTRQFIIEGKFPWPLSAEIDREAIYWSWTLRTQPIPWLVDDPIKRAAYSIYSTNSFRVQYSQDARATLSEIICAPKGSKVVADVSALITLHSLGLLEKAADYYERVLIPANYIPKIISDMNKLFPHQLSQKNAAEHIKSAVDRKVIAVKSKDVTDNCAFVLDEYQDGDEAGGTPYRLADLIETLHSKGFVTDVQRDHAVSVAHKDPAAGKNRSPLQIGNTVCISEATLVTLASIDWLDLVVKHFSIQIKQVEFDDVMSRLQAFQALDSSQRKHKDLWDSIQSSDRFEFVPATKALAISGEDEIDRDIATAAYLVAKERKLPLLVDDRVCQTLLLNEMKESPVAAFGTDVLILDMARSGALTFDEAADALLDLVAWRYRFILVPAEILKLLADRYRSHPPGASLRQIAVYVHDCMRDEGMFAGLEPTDPPVSIAVRLYQTWIHNISEFIMDTWMDDAIDESSAREITNWAITEFLPSPPRVADDRLQSTIASLTPRTAISRALIRSTNGVNIERVNRGLRFMSSELGLTEAEYLKIVAGVVNGI